MSRLNVVGRSFPKADAAAKLIGAAVYADDIALPRMLHCKILRSPHPHARVLSVDASAARRIPGVKAVITGEDLPIRFGILPVSQDERALEAEKVRYVGDPVAAVAAIDEETAAAACEAVRVEYEALEPVMSIEAGLRQPKDERIHPSRSLPGNVHRLQSYEFGDLDAGWARAAHVREDLFFFQGNTHLPMEQHSAVAQWVDGRLTLWSSTQVVHYVHRALAKVLELPMDRIRVVGAVHGGGFGGKTDPFAHEIVVAKLAMATGRPVKCTLTREEVFYAHRGRHPVLMWVKTGVDADGRITPCTSGAPSTGVRTAPTARRRSSTRAPCRPSPTTSPPTSSRACASSPTSPPAAPSAGTARRSRASRSSSTWTRSPTTSASTRS